mmetsp:Transcript_65471/g.170406  ORF Transcript_65471/g.170406 Transcript_65471/m.170406 type:complete len:225 (+) Transcript_65471:107-781(+)
MAAVPEDLTQREKFDADGNYLRFPGVTIVCDMLGTDAGYAIDLPSVLRQQPILGKLMSPLPPASYHITLLDVCTQYKLNLDDHSWSKKLQDPCWAAAAQELLEAQYTPQLRVQEVTMWNGGIGVVLESADEGTPGHPQDVPISMRIMEILGLTHPQKHPWHFTLGYCVSRESYDKVDPCALDAERLAVEFAVRQAFPGVVQLGPALLCRFPDMTSFVPWDGLDQ